LGISQRNRILILDLKVSGILNTNSITSPLSLSEQPPTCGFYPDQLRLHSNSLGLAIAVCHPFPRILNIGPHHPDRCTEVPLDSRNGPFFRDQTVRQIDLGLMGLESFSVTGQANLGLNDLHSIMEGLKRVELASASRQRHPEKAHHECQKPQITPPSPE
jgi:hypothetical protein